MNSAAYKTIEQYRAEIKWDQLSPNKQAFIQETMDRYGENTWWLAKDPIEALRFQFYEDVVLIPIENYEKGLSAIIGRPVGLHEVVVNRDNLEVEFNEGIEALDKGGYLELSQSVQSARLADSMDLLVDYLARTREDTDSNE